MRPLSYIQPALQRHPSALWSKESEENEQRSADMVPMPNFLKVLDSSAQILEVVLLERDGQRLRLRSPFPIASGAPAQLTLQGEVLLGEVTLSIPRAGYFEVGLQAQQVLTGSGHIHSAWRELYSGKSIMGSLVALNERLVFEENDWRMGKRAPHNSTKSS